MKYWQKNQPNKQTKKPEGLNKGKKVKTGQKWSQQGFVEGKANLKNKAVNYCTIKNGFLQE